MLAGLALNIIDGVPDLTDRRVLMSYYWHAEDVQSKKVPDVLKRNGFLPAKLPVFLLHSYIINMFFPPSSIQAADHL